MHVRKEHAGASSTGHTWEHDGAVVEVPDHVGGDLLLHAPAEFTDVTAEHVARPATDSGSTTEDEDALQGESEGPAGGEGAGEPADDLETSGGVGELEGGVVGDPEQPGESDATGEEGSTAEQTDATENTDKPKRKYTRRTPISD